MEYRLKRLNMLNWEEYKKVNFLDPIEELQSKRCGYESKIEWLKKEFSEELNSKSDVMHNIARPIIDHIGIYERSINHTVNEIKKLEEKLKECEMLHDLIAAEVNNVPAKEVIKVKISPYPFSDWLRGEFKTFIRRKGINVNSGIDYISDSYFNPFVFKNWVYNNRAPRNESTCRAVIDRIICLNYEGKDQDKVVSIVEDAMAKWSIQRSRRKLNED